MQSFVFSYITFFLQLNHRSDTGILSNIDKAANNNIVIVVVSHNSLSIISVSWSYSLNQEWVQNVAKISDYDA